MSKNLSELTGRQGLKNNLFEQFTDLVKETPKPDAHDLEKLADEFLIGTANVYGSISFYDFLRPDNQGKKVYLCNGTACLCAGTQENLHKNLLEHFNNEEIGEMCCLGRCHENHAFQYNGKNYSGDLNESLEQILSNESQQRDQYHVASSGRSILTNGTVELPQFNQYLLDILARQPSDILAEIEASHLRGRGGAGFPIAIKLKTCKDADSNIKFIICNGDEGDPGAFSDRYLLEQRPCDVLMGMIISGYVTGATWGVVYIRGEYPESVNIINNTIQSLRNEQLLGENIQGTGFSFDFKIIKAQGSYICGEETALISSIEGQRPEVRIRPPFPAEQGLFNKPTVVNNVETLAALPFIVKNGGASFASIGTNRSKGTKLLSLDSGFKKPGIYEVDMGIALSEVFNLAGGYSKPIKALHIGGPLGGIVPVDQVQNLTVDFESFSEQGFLLGHASVVTIPEKFPLIKYLEHIFEFASEESCGKCFPCRLGTKRAQELFQKAQEEDYKIERQLISDLLHTLEVGSLCAHGGGIPLPVRNLLDHFDNELKPYFSSIKMKN